MPPDLEGENQVHAFAERGRRQPWLRRERMREERLRELAVGMPVNFVPFLRQMERDDRRLRKPLEMREQEPRLRRLPGLRNARVPPRTGNINGHAEQQEKLQEAIREMNEGYEQRRADLQETVREVVSQGVNSNGRTGFNGTQPYTIIGD